MSLSPAFIRRWRGPAWPGLVTPIIRVQIVGSLAFLGLRPFFGLLHEILVFSLAGLVRSLSAAPLWSELVVRLPMDPVYTLALVQFTGEIRARGIAVAEPIGGLLQALWPALFTAPSLGVGAWASTVLEPGAAVAARWLVGFGADVSMLTLGFALFMLGRRRWPWLMVCGALQQAHIVLYHFVGARLSFRDLEAAGLPFAMASLISGPNDRAPWFTTQLEHLPAPLVALGPGLSVALLAYLVLGLLLAIWRGVRFGVAGGQRLGRVPCATASTWADRRLPVVVMGLGVLAVAVTPLGAFAQAETCLVGQARRVVTVSEPVTTTDAGPAAAPDAASAVNFIGEHYHYALLVDGVPTVVRGMGYSPLYGSLSADERAGRYDRDFGQMRQIGVNVLFGWFQDRFDQLTLAKARQYGLGVGMPYELNQDLDYDDPNLRARVTADVLSWVAQYKDDPAVWFWTPANEVIHRLIFPSWLKHENDPVREARATSFANFYVQLIDQIHALDPNHPIIYRDAEDVYLARIRDALQRDGIPRPWFGYGANVYSGRLGEILDNWPRQGIDAPLLISEFSPGGTGPADRPAGLRSMWGLIRSYPDYVIGGAVYTWTSEGPEELDRVFGLVDGAGQPRDGSLAAVADLYLGERN